MAISESDFKAKAQELKLKTAKADAKVDAKSDKKLPSQETGKQKVQMIGLKAKTIKVKIVGDTPLLMNKFSDRSKEKILNKQTQKSSVRGARDTKMEVEQAIHRMPSGKIGFPASAFKKASVECAPYFPDLDKKLVKGAIHVIGGGNNLVEIKFKKQVVNETNVKIAMGRSAEIRFRPEFQDWSCELFIRYNENLISAEQIINLLNYAGFQIGVGDWNPQHSGTFGMFHVA